MLKMKKRYIKVCVIVAVPVILLAGFSYASNLSLSKEKESLSVSSAVDETDKGNTFLDSIFGKKKKDSVLDKEVDISNNTVDKIVMIHPTIIDRDANSITILVNKELPLPKDYEPDDLVIPDVTFAPTASNDNSYLRQIAATYLEYLFEDALLEGIQLNAVSGYRSYERQYNIFTNNIKNKGLSHTAEFSAKPGYSEHQTGLVMDVSSESANNQLEEKFGDTVEGIWLANNAHKYGFFIRYPKDKTDITGYAYEPWHIRYVGQDLATYLYESNLTLEEYYGFQPSIDFDTELRFDTLWKYGIDINDVLKPTVTPTPVVEEGELVDGGLIDEELIDGDLVNDELIDGELIDDIVVGDEVTPTPSNTSNDPIKPTPTSKPTSSPTPTSTPTPTEVIKPTVIPTDTVTPTPTIAPTTTPLVSPTPTKAPSVEPTDYPYTDPEELENPENQADGLE